MSREPDEFDVPGAPSHRFAVARRDFFRVMGAGVAVACTVRAGDAAQDAARPAPPREIGAWVHVGEDGVVSAFTGKTEVGQDIRTSLTQAVSEELRVPRSAVRMVMADTTLTPFDDGTMGSRTTPQMSLQLRRAAAAARRALLQLAADAWGVAPGELQSAGGVVTATTLNRRATYAELSGGRRLLQLIDDQALTPVTAWTEMGTAVPKVNGADFVTGRHLYTTDLTRPGMRHGAVLRAPSTGAVLLSADTTAAERSPGVRIVRDTQFVGVTAPTRSTAIRAVAAIRAEWKESPGPSSATVFDYFKTHRETDAGGQRTMLPPHVVGSTAVALTGADTIHAATYSLDYIAHVPLEPRAAVAEWSGDSVTVWTGTQRPFPVRQEIASALGITPNRVRVIVPDTGSAYGGKHSGEAAVEAARLARADAHPVKLVWTRQEEFTSAYFRPGGIVDVKTGVSKDGRITALEFDSYNAGPAAIRTIYDIPNQRIEMHPTRSPLRVGSYRGLAATANHFVRETHLDEIAAAIGMDPLDLRLKNLSDVRQRAVLLAAAERAGWRTRPRVQRLGAGIACGFEKGSYVATVAEVSLDARGTVQVERLTVAFECGAIVNPNGLRNQVEGAVVQGIGGALFERVEFDRGRIVTDRLARYRVPRLRDVPPIHIVLVDRPDLAPAGAGETPIVAVAPAIGNAIFAASGVRLRHMPLVPGGRLSRA